MTVLTPQEARDATLLAYRNAIALHRDAGDERTAARLEQAMLAITQKPVVSKKGERK